MVHPTKGYGFIQPDNGGKDVFVHISAVEKAGLSSLNEGAKVSYEVVANRGKEFSRKPQGRLTVLMAPRAHAGGAKQDRCDPSGGTQRNIQYDEFA